MRMKPEIRKLWTAALRSGDYRQGHNKLTYITADGMEHCCLGVLCELAVRAGVNIPVVDSYISRSYDGDFYVLPKAVMEWAGLRSSDPTVKAKNGRVSVNGEKVRLSSVNDGAGSGVIEKHTFDEIADLIDAQLT